MIWNFIVDHIPVWVYVVVAVLGAGALFYFFSPVLIPLWNILPGWLKWLLGGIAAIFLAYVGGRYKGSHDEEERERQRDADALKKRKEVDDNVAKMDPKTVKTDLDKWRRD
jgi:membrane protein implicated in regulation of membrane protease activity